VVLGGDADAPVAHLDPQPLADAARAATAVASISVERPGTQASFPRADELPPTLLPS
jgi:sugar/nucleoside kinase (ribokinase family)